MCRFYFYVGLNHLCQFIPFKLGTLLPTSFNEYPYAVLGIPYFRYLSLFLLELIFLQGRKPASPSALLWPSREYAVQILGGPDAASRAYQADEGCHQVQSQGHVQAKGFVGWTSMWSLQQSWSSKSLQQMHQGGLLRQGVPEGRLEGAQEDLPRRLSKEELDFLTSWYFWFSKRFGRKCCINVFKFWLNPSI